MTTLTRRNLLGGAAALAAGAPLRPCVPGGAEPSAPSRPTLEVGPGGRCWFQAPGASTTADGAPWPGAPSVPAVDEEVHVRWAPHRCVCRLRPVVATSGTRRALAWTRGTDRSWTDVDARILVRLA